MIALPGIHVGIYNVDPVLVFEATTWPKFIDSWVIGQFENVRVDGAAASFRKGFRFFADEVLAMDTSEMDHHDEVIDNEPVRNFAVQRIHGPRYPNELKRQPRERL